MAEFAVIGLGRFGVATSMELMRLGNSVLGIDIHPELVNKVADKITLAVKADATDEASLTELNISNCDAVIVAIGESLEASILCVMLLKSLHVKEIWVRAASLPHHSILSKLGVSRIIHPEEDIAIRVAQSLNYPMVNQYMSIGGGNYIVEVQINTKSQHQSIAQLLKKANGSIEAMLVRRHQKIIKEPAADFVVENDDSLVLLGALTELKHIAAALLPK